MPTSTKVKKYRKVELPAADTRAASQHVSAQPPASEATKRAYRMTIVEAFR